MLLTFDDNEEEDDEEKTTKSVYEPLGAHVDPSRAVEVNRAQRTARSQFLKLRKQVAKAYFRNVQTGSA